MVKKSAKNNNTGTRTKPKDRVGTRSKVKSIVNIEAKSESKNEKIIMRAWFIGIIILVILLSGFLIYKYFIKPNNYLIQNKYYGFSLKTPSGWKGEEETLYTEDNVSNILVECNKDTLEKSNTYEIGAFRFKSQKYPDDVDFSSFTTAGFPSGIILRVTVNCLTNVTKNRATEYYNGETKNIAFFKNNLKYVITEDMYISPADKNKSDKLKEEYEETLNDIISSFKVTR
jgi:hypothetical protein